jgi:hypothetical protein
MKDDMAIARYPGFIDRKLSVFNKDSSRQSIETFANVVTYVNVVPSQYTFHLIRSFLFVKT